MRQHHTADAVDQFVDICPAHQLALLLRQLQLQHLGLDRDVCRVGFRAQRLPPLVRSCCVAVEYSDCSVSVRAVSTAARML
jgi:hypothetical protein